MKNFITCFNLSTWIFIIYVWGSATVLAQNIAIPIGSSAENEGATTLIKGPSGDYYVAGYFEDEGMVTRVTNGGAVVWSKSIDLGPDPDYILNLELTSDNFIIGCGNARTAGSDNPYGFVFKMDLSGSVVWSRQFVCDDLYMWTNGLTESANGNYRVVGSYKNLRLNNYAIEFNSITGAQEWDTVYVRSNISNSWDESFYDIVTHNTNDAEYIVGRFQKSGSNTTYRPSLTKINPDGSFGWSKTYIYNDSPSGGRYYGFSIDQDEDSLVMGLLCRDGGSSPPFETGIVKTDLDGNISWAKLYKSPGNDLRSYNMVTVSDGYLLAGWIESGDKSLFMIKTDKEGSVLWAKKYGAGNDENVYLSGSNSRVIQDGDYAVTVGRSNSFSATFDAFLVKADLSTGELSEGSCFEDLEIVESSLPDFQADYPMVILNLPIIDSNPTMPITDLSFESNGVLMDDDADTLIGGDTLMLCSGESVTVLADWSPSLDFFWSTGGTDQTEVVSETGTYWVEVSGEGCVLWSDTVHVIVDSLSIDLGSDTSICDMDTYLLDAGFIEGVTYLWNDGSTDQTLIANSDGWNWCTVENEVCAYTDSVELMFGFVEVDLGSDSTICFGESVLLDAENPGSTYEWIDGSTDQTLTVVESGNYWVEVHVDDCVVRDTVDIVVSDIRVDLVNDTILCIGESLLLDAGVIAGTYLWNDGTIKQTYLVTTDGTYSVVVTDGICTHSDETSVVYFEPTANFEASPLEGCAPLYVSYNDLSLTPMGVIDGWHWSFGDGATSLIENPTHTYAVPGVYDVSLTIDTDLGCSDEVVILNYITVSESVEANFSFTPSYITAEDLVSFTNLSVNATSWIWDFGDGNSSTEENPTHTFAGTGEYTITLIATNENGCDDTIVYKLIVRDAVYVFIPNVFTPDGDSFNEVWKPFIYGIDVYDFHLVLFNRWGEVIWESFDASIGWDGTYGNNGLVQDGVYVWSMTYGDLWTDEQFKLQGHITVLK